MAVAQETAVLNISATTTAAIQAFTALGKHAVAILTQLRQAVSQTSIAMRALSTISNNVSGTIKRSFASTTAAVQTTSQQAVISLQAIGTAANTAAGELGKIGGAAARGAAAVNNAAGKARQSVNSLGANIFRFRENITGLFNGVTNLVARTFRAVARLRTAFFILLTVLAIRPIIRFFQDLATYSGSAALEFSKFYDWVAKLLALIGEKAAPLLKFVFELTKAGITSAVGFLSSAHGVIELLVQSIEVLIDGLKLIGYGLIVVIQSLRAIYNLSFALGSAIAYIRAKFLEFISFILSKLTDLSAKIFGNLKEALSGSWFVPEWLLDFITKLENFQRKASKVAEEFKADYAAVAEVAKSTAAAAFEAAAKNAESAAAAFPKLLGVLEDLYSLSPEGRKFTELLQQLVTDTIRILKELEDSPNLAALVAGVTTFAAGFVQAVGDAKAALLSFGQAVEQSLERGFSDTFLEIMAFRFNKFRDIVVNTLESLKKAIADFLAKQAVSALLGSVLGPIVSGAANLLTGGLFGGGNEGPGTLINAAGEEVNIATGTVIPAGGRLQASLPTRTALPVGRTMNVQLNISSLDGADTLAVLTKHKQKILDIFNEAGSGGDLVTRTTIGRR